MFADRGIKYEFRISGKNHLGYGQEAITYIQTPEGGNNYQVYLI